MAGIYLVPIHLAIPLTLLILALTPLTPLACAWITCTTLARGFRKRDAPLQTAKTLLRQILLALILPWAAITLLSAMIAAQVLLTPCHWPFTCGIWNILWRGCRRGCRLRHRRRCQRIWVRCRDMGLHLSRMGRQRRRQRSGCLPSSPARRGAHLSVAPSQRWNSHQL